MRDVSGGYCEKSSGGHHELRQRKAHHRRAEQWLARCRKACFAMMSKNKAKPTRAESEHIERVKNLPCSVCDAPAPSEAHEPNQGQWFTSIALCADCHRGSVNGLHGQRVMWRIHKMDEWAALNVTIRRMFT